MTPTFAVGRLGPDGAWIGFAASATGTYDLVAGGASIARVAAEPDDLLALAIAYFEDALESAPEEMAATLADIGALVRHVAAAEPDGPRAHLLAEAVDAVDDGLATDVVVSRLVACLIATDEPIARLERRAIELLGEEGG